MPGVNSVPAGEICDSVALPGGSSLRWPCIPLASQPGCFSLAEHCTCACCLVPTPHTPALLLILQKGLHKNIFWEQ